MMNTEKPQAKSKVIFKILGITFAWLSLPVIGLLLLFITTQSSTIQQSLLNLGKNSDIAIYNGRPKLHNPIRPLLPV